MILALQRMVHALKRALSLTLAGRRATLPAGVLTP